MAEDFRKTVIGEGEDPSALSARTGVPLCMLLRANRLVCAAWLLPGREIVIPPMGFCENDVFPCPGSLFDISAQEETAEVCVAGEGDTVSSIAQTLGTAERIVLLARGKKGPVHDGERFLIKNSVRKKEARSVLPGESIGMFCERCGIGDVQALMRINALENACIWPGMRLILPDTDRV